MYAAGGCCRILLRRQRSMAFLSYMIYVLMCSWLMRERCTYPKLDIAVSINDRCVRLVESYLISTSSASLHMHESIMSMAQPADRSLAESPISMSTLSTLPLNPLSELPLMSMSRFVADEAAMNLMQAEVGIPNVWHKRPHRPHGVGLRTPVPIIPLFTGISSQLPPPSA